MKCCIQYLVIYEPNIQAASGYGDIVYVYAIFVSMICVTTELEWSKTFFPAQVNIPDHCHCHDTELASI